MFYEVFNERYGTGGVQEIGEHIWKEYWMLKNRVKFVEMQANGVLSLSFSPNSTVKSVYLCVIRNPTMREVPLSFSKNCKLATRQSWSAFEHKFRFEPLKLLYSGFSLSG